MYNLYGIMPIMRCTLEYIQKEYFELDKTWDESKEFCKTWGGRLATVSSFSENQYMIRRLGDVLSIWIGGSDLKSEGTWVWTNYSQEGKLIQPTFWGPNQPNNYNEQDCLAFYKFYDGYGWDDDQCHLQYHFMCEK
ncbi:C-type lectin domain family 17, member A-like isoform X1 [Mytilus californianus]|uniref:C-type lectin domain family 17, member A-like isoform X1 n=1 Tax=Mytilus californianus TaxID=6549 RepID=UPI0022462F20|nr:C-type lectin domain family 17, member A-like isoform X1 [Mytilus californianus]